MDNKRRIRLLNSPKLRFWGSWRNLKIPVALYQKKECQLGTSYVAFLHGLNALLSLVKEGTIVNPFKVTGPELVALDTGEIMDFEVSKGLKEVPDIGKYMFSECVPDILEKASKPLSAVIPRANVYTFSHQAPID
jgi:hypothetical protein